MIDQLAAAADLTPTEFALAGVAVFLASVVRGFSGFALSAIVMASLAVIIAPVELIPLCWFLEMTAGLLMVRGGFAEADRGIVAGLVIGSVVATPAGLYLTTTLPVETSRSAALGIVLVLAVLQLARVRWRFLATTPGLYAGGLTAGIATGLASVGGMVVALYVLSRDVRARTMRASLVLFLFATGVITFFYLVFYGLMTGAVLARAAMAAPLVVCGVPAGRLMFRPAMERHYKRFCLLLLIGLAGAGLARATGVV